MEDEDGSSTSDYHYRCRMEALALRDQISAARHTVPPDLLAGAAVPAWLVEPWPVVKSRAGKVVRRAVQESSWRSAVTAVELLPIDATPGDLVLGGSAALIAGDHVQLRAVPEALVGTGRGGGKTPAHRELLLEGLEHFWFCLATLRDVHVLPHGAAAEARLSFARAALPHYLRWWPLFVWLDRRFWNGGMRGWPASLWAAVPLALCRFLGVPDAELNECLRVDAATLGESIATWVSRS